MTTATLSPLILRNGATIEDVLERTLEFIAIDSSYRKYDLAPVAHDATLTREDVRVANWMIARMSPRVIDAIHERAPAIDAGLAQIPPTATLAAADGDIPWAALAELMAALQGVPEVGLARATKVLHKKRPALIPILDSILERYLRGVERIARTGGFAVYAVALIRSFKRELDLSLPTLRALQRELHARGIEMTECRLLDLFLWGYSGTYTPLYRREGGDAVAAPAPPQSAAAMAVFAGIEVFRDNDAGYLAWLDDHPAGFVLNAARAPRADYLILHRASCRTINGRPTRGGPWTGPSIKTCADDELLLAAWAATPPEACRPAAGSAAADRLRHPRLSRGNATSSGPKPKTYPARLGGAQRPLREFGTRPAEVARSDRALRAEAASRTSHDPFDCEIA